MKNYHARIFQKSLKCPRSDVGGIAEAGERLLNLCRRKVDYYFGVMRDLWTQRAQTGNSSDFCWTFTTPAPLCPLWTPPSRVHSGPKNCLGQRTAFKKLGGRAA